MKNENLLFGHPVDLMNNTLANIGSIDPCEFHSMISKLNTSNKKNFLSLYNLNHSYITLNSEGELKTEDIEKLISHIKKLLKLELIISNKLDLINKDTLFIHSHIKDSGTIVFRFYSPEILYIMFNSESIFGISNDTISLVCDNKTYYANFVNKSLNHTLLIRLFLNSNEKENIINLTFPTKVMKNKDLKMLFVAIADLEWMHGLYSEGKYNVYIKYNASHEDINLIVDYINELSLLGTRLKANMLSDQDKANIIKLQSKTEYPDYLRHLKIDDFPKLFQSSPSRFIAIYYIKEFLSVLDLEEYFKINLKIVNEIKTKTVHSQYYLRDYLTVEFDSEKESEDFLKRYDGNIYKSSPLVFYYINEDIVFK